MTKPKLMRWSLAAAAAASLVFGTTQVFAAPGAQKASSFCPGDCIWDGCPPGCPGDCINGQCYCSC
jgi:hypothetical protein